MTNIELIAKSVCANVCEDLHFGIGNPYHQTMGYIKDESLARQALDISRRLDPQITGLSEQVRVLQKAKVAQASRIGNCGECGRLAAAYLFTNMGVRPIRLWEHPTTAQNDDNHCFVSFQLANQGVEYVIDVWAYIVMRHLVHAERSRFGVHPLSQHQQVANELYQTWGETAPAANVFCTFENNFLQNLDVNEINRTGLTRQQTLEQETRGGEAQLQQLRAEIESLIGQGVASGRIPAPSNPRASICADSNASMRTA